MRTTLLSFLMILSSLSLSGDGRRRAVAVSPLADEVTITFVDVTSALGSDAAVDAGVIAWRKRGSRPDVTTSRRTFGIRIDRTSGETRGTATLRASLESFDGRARVRVDGVELGATPRIINPLAPIGSVTAHVLEIEVPVTAPEGAFSSAIRWEVMTN